MEVSVNGSKSEVYDVFSGVPQESVLGPLLFVIYINIMLEKVEQLKSYLYSDDLKVFMEISSEEESQLLQDNLDKMYDWTQYSLLKFNPDKCETMRIKSNLKKVSVVRS